MYLILSLLAGGDQRREMPRESGSSRSHLNNVAGYLVRAARFGATCVSSRARLVRTVRHMVGCGGLCQYFEQMVIIEVGVVGCAVCYGIPAIWISKTDFRLTTDSLFLYTPDPSLSELNC